MIGNDIEELTEAVLAGRRHEPELGKMRSHRVGKLRTLPGRRSGGHASVGPTIAWLMTTGCDTLSKAETVAVADIEAGVTALIDSGDSTR